VEPSGVRIAATGGDVLIVDADIDGTQLSVGRLAEAIAAHR
jgi:hypothetical protein